MRKGKGGSQPSTAPPVCYKAVESSEEKDAMKGRSGYPDVFCKKGALKNFPPVLTSFLNTVAGFQHATLSKRL